MALQYIAHSDPTERQARIIRVQQSQPSSAADSLPRRPKITHDLDKGKGHIFGYEGQFDMGFKRKGLPSVSTVSAPVVQERGASDINGDRRLLPLPLLIVLRFLGWVLLPETSFPGLRLRVKGVGDVLRGGRGWLRRLG
uniref:Uncharacterized protein n=1 Tax=Brassica oleracea TaxID=3712 RepID=A0A3P6DLL1_BRAOL|nr:unnamed protein product [Brassica oleracea]